MPHIGDRAPVSIPNTKLMQIGRPLTPVTPGSPIGVGALPNDPNDASLWLPGQGQTNACGTTTLAYILLHLMGPGAPSRQAIDQEIRRGNIFSAPGLLASFARTQGLAAELYDSLPIDALFELVDRAIPVMVLLDTTPLNLMDTANLHWVAVVGHDEQNVAVYNPHGFQEQLDLFSFQSHWQQAALFGLPAWRSLAIAIAPAGTSLPHHVRSPISALGANLAAGGIARIANARESMRSSMADRTRRGPTAMAFTADAARIVGGAAQTALGSLALLVGAAARRLSGRPR